MITTTPILQPTHRWQCPSCWCVDVTHEMRPHTRMHACTAHGMLTTPMVLLAAGQAELERAAVRHVEVDREDYVGEDHGNVTLHADTGRPVMAIRTERSDGSFDCTVYAPAASLAMGGAPRKEAA